MIEFSCPVCGRQFNVPDKHANRKAVCKSCQFPLVVPPAAGSIPIEIATPAAPPPVEKLPVRTRRIQADLEQIQQTFMADSLIRLIAFTWLPVETYFFDFAIRGIERIKSKEPIFRDLHRAEVRMTRDYPRLAPACRMITPIFHPNIDTSAICIGDHWTAGERLADLIVRIGEMIAYQAYNIKSPLNAEAAMWADLNREKIPVDSRNLNPAALERVS
jgi:ubiquitin-protein ligase